MKIIKARSFSTGEKLPSRRYVVLVSLLLIAGVPSVLLIRTISAELAAHRQASAARQVDSAESTRTIPDSTATEPPPRAMPGKNTFDMLDILETPPLPNGIAPEWLTTNESAKRKQSLESENDEDDDASPDGARAFRNLQLRDEKGEIPVDGLQKARRQMDRMRAFSELRAKAAAQPEGIEVAGLDPGDWSWLGPGNIGGRIRSIVIDPNNPLNIWAGSVSGGIWRTTNSGNSWQPVNDFMANLAVTTLIMNPSHTAVMYAGTGEGFSNTDSIKGGGVFQSTNSGTTWNLLPGTDPAAPNPPGCGVGSAPCSAFWSYVNRLAIAPNGTILAATGGADTSVRPGINIQGGIARSINGGATWTQQTAVSSFDVDFDPNNSANAIAGGLASIQVSTDFGVTWNPPVSVNPAIVNGGTVATNGRVELAYAPSSSNIIYASVNQNQGDVYRSADSGQNFTRVNSGTNLLGTVGWYANALWVNPQDPTFLLVGGVNLWQSGDSGATFALKGDNRTDSSVHVDHHVFVANPTFNNSTDKSVYFGNDGGVYRVDDISTFSRTSGWTERNNNLGVTQFYGGAITPNGVVFGGTQDNGTIRVLPTPNLDPPYNTETWAEVYGSDGGYVAADPTDANYLYGETQNLGIVRSTDGGATASFIYCNPAPATGVPCPPGSGITEAWNNGSNFIAPFILDPSDPNTMLAGGLSLWRSTDVKTAGLPTWAIAKSPNPTIPPPGPAPTPTPSPNPISAVVVSPTNSNFIVVGHNDGQIWLSLNGTNGSPTWNPINAPPYPAGGGSGQGRIVTRLAIDDTKAPNWIYATFGGFSNNNVWVTGDLGATWVDVSGATGTATDLPAVPVRSIVINPANANFLYVGTEIGVFASEDAGTTWLLPQDGPANVSVDELFISPQGDLMAATHGRGMYTTRAPVLDLPACFWSGDSGPPCPPPSARCRISEFQSICCVPGDWNCPCTWNNRQIPTVNDDVAVYCPITVNGAATARNLRVDGRLSLTSGGVSVQGDVANFGLIESVGPFSSNITANNVLNVRPEHAVTLRGIISLNLPWTVRGGIANYGIITGAGIDLTGPAGAIQNLSGTGEWNSTYLRINRTAQLTTDVTLNNPSVIVQPFARLNLNNRTLTVNGNSFSNTGAVDLGTGTFNFRGNQFQSFDPSQGDINVGVKGSGTVNVSPASGTSDFTVAYGSFGTFQPSLRIQSGTVNTVFRGQIDRSLIVEAGARFNLNEGSTTVNGDITVNGTIAKSVSFTPSDLNFNGSTFTNNGSVMIDFIQFSTTGAPRTQFIAGTGAWPAATSFTIGAGARSTTTLMNDVTLNHSQLGVSSSPAGSALNLGNFTLSYGGNSLATPSGGIIGTGTIRMQPLDGTSNLNGTGTDPIATGVTIASGAVTPGTRVSGPFTVDPGATLSGGGLHFMGNTFTNNGTIASTSLSFGSPNFQPIAHQLGGTGLYTGSGQMFFRPESTVTMFSDVTYVGSRIYNEGRLNTSAFTLTLPCPTGSEGPGEIVGNVRRTNLTACTTPMAFGSPFTTIQFTSGTPPTEIAVNTLLSAPLGFPSGVRRTYLITPTGGSGYTATLRLHYLDSELNGNNESSLQLWRNNGTNWTMQGVTNRNTIDNWVEYAGVTQFSPWAISQLAPTAANVSVSGRVATSSGIGIPRAAVHLTNSAGEVRTIITNGFGYYRLDDVAAGQSYVVSVSHKQFQFATQIVDVTEEITELNFIAENSPL